MADFNWSLMLALVIASIPGALRLLTRVLLSIAFVNQEIHLGLSWRSWPIGLTIAG